MLCWAELKMENSETKKSEPFDTSSWVEEHGDYLYRHALLRVRNSELAEDLVQETFLSAVKAIKSFEGRSSVRTWLRTILKNKIIDHTRKRDREQAVIDKSESFEEREQYFGKMGIWKNTFPSWGRDPESALSDKDFYRILTQCLEKLPQRVARVFSLRMIDHKEIGEICKILDISASNTSVILYRARMALRSCLERNWFSGSR